MSWRSYAGGLAFACLLVSGAAAAELQDEGTIAGVNLVSREILLTDGNTLSVPADFLISIQGQPARLEDLKQGERIRARYEERGGGTRCLPRSKQCPMTATAGMMDP